MREALISRYFPVLFPIRNQLSSIDNHQSIPLVADDSPEFGRKCLCAMKCSTLTLALLLDGIDMDGGAVL
jgi:hypothetical protein